MSSIALPLPVIQFHLVPGGKGEWPAYGAAYGKVPNQQDAITPREHQLLRTLAGQVAELAARPIEAEKRDLWFRHNAPATHAPGHLL